MGDVLEIRSPTIAGAEVMKRASAILPFVCLLGILCAGMGWSIVRPSRGLAEIPVTYWAWRNDAPSGADVRAATGRGRGSALFLRAGQIELKKDALRRIRPAGGVFPDRLPIHLVYNATPEVLLRFERIEPASLAACILETFAADRDRARHENATVAGLQLDIDCPTRLLGRYRETLRIVRAGLPAGYGLSITGLPTWMNAPELPQLLKETDFWTPQCYGWRIPETMADLTPIAEPEAVGRAVARAEKLGHPYFAGIAAYGYLLHFDRAKRRLSLRGDISVAEIRNFPARLIDRDSVFETWRAETDFVIDGLGVRAGEFLVFEKPSSERFAASLEAARTSSGPALRGFCLFRLPAPDDPTTLPLDAVAAALNGQSASSATTSKPEAAPSSRSIHFPDQPARTGSTERK